MRNKAIIITLMLAFCASMTTMAATRYKRGDIDHDGSVSPSDISALINYLLNGVWPEDPEPDPEPGPETFTVNGVSFTMLPVEGGTFTMGATSEQGTSDPYSSEYPVHQVTVSDFSLGQLEVTQELWLAVMGYNPSYYTSYNGYLDNLKRPVEQVSWGACQAFCAELTRLTGRHFRLPTEAEWEFAARGGNQSRHYKYAGSNTSSAVAWFWEDLPSHQAKAIGYGTQTVATKAANELGFYDMSGNVFEWCQDWYAAYTADAQTDPKGPETSTWRVCRGGDFYHFDRCCRVCYRYLYKPDVEIHFLGLRLALDNRPIVRTEIGDDAMTISATGYGNVALYVDGQAVSNPYNAPRGNEDYVIEVYATSQKPGKQMLQSETEYLVVPAKAQVYTVNGVSFSMVPVEGGTFTMGATSEQLSEAYDDETPAHNVTLADFSIGKTEVTQELWMAVMGSNPSNFTGDAQRPVENVSWNECQTFINRLNSLTGANFRLPTEAEWEFAARGGNPTYGYKYSGGYILNNVGWFRNNAYDVGSGSQDYGTHAVATKAPNELGLFDMSGNVWEWCQDWKGSYTDEAQSSPTGPYSGIGRIARGGSWDRIARLCRVSNRNNYSPMTRSNSLGLRLAM